MMNTTVIISTEMNLEEEIKLIRGYEAQIKELGELKKEKEAKIKKLMDKAGVSELKVGGFMVRYTKYIKNQFDTSKFKLLHAKLYSQFIKHTNSSKFTIA